MAVAVMEAAGDDGPLRIYAGEKLGTRGGDAAVMADFEQRALETGSASIACSMGAFSITFKHHGSCAVGHVQDQRVVLVGSGPGW